MSLNICFTLTFQTFSIQPERENTLCLITDTFSPLEIHLVPDDEAEYLGASCVGRGFWWATPIRLSLHVNARAWRNRTASFCHIGPHTHWRIHWTWHSHVHLGERKVTGGKKAHLWWNWFRLERVRTDQREFQMEPVSWYCFLQVDFIKLYCGQQDTNRAQGDRGQLEKNLERTQ